MLRNLTSTAICGENARMFKALHDYLLVRPEKTPEFSPLVVISKDRMNRGTVVAAGPGKWLRTKSGLIHEPESGVFLPNTVKVGDFVTYTDLDIFPKWRERDGMEQFVIIQEADVTWIEEREPEEQRAA
jgi:co-chaperonin GroES (HSP10)